MTLPRLATRCFLIATLLAAPTAHAYDDMLTVGVSAGATFLANPEVDAGCCGPSLGLSASLPVAERFAVRGFVLGSGFPASRGLWTFTLGAEWLYPIDILRWVPLLGLGAAAHGTWLDGAADGEGFALEWSAHVLIGVDYLLSRSLVLGWDLRPTVVFASSFEDGRADPFAISVTARLSWRFDL